MRLRSTWLLVAFVVGTIAGPALHGIGHRDDHVHVGAQGAPVKVDPENVHVHVHVHEHVHEHSHVPEHDPLPPPRDDEPSDPPPSHGTDSLLHGGWCVLVAEVPAVVAAAVAVETATDIPEPHDGPRRIVQSPRRSRAPPSA